MRLVRAVLAPSLLGLSVLMSGCSSFPTHPLSARPDEQVARAHLQRRCVEDGGIHILSTYALPAARPVFRRSSRWTSQYPGVMEPVGVFNDRFEVWQSVSWEDFPPLRMRRTKTVLLEPASGKELAVAVNYRLVRSEPTSADAQCGDSTLDDLARAVFKE